MTTATRFAIAVLPLFCLVSVSWGEEVKDTHLRETWLARVRNDLGKLDGAEQSSAAEYAILGVAASGESELAKSIARQFLPPERGPGALVLIADTQSSNDQLRDSLITIGELLTEDERQRALALVTVRQAQRGDLEDASMLLSKIKQRRWRDLALSAIAEAQAVAEQLDAARATLKQISDDEKRQETQKKVDSAKADPVRKIQSEFLRQQIQAMLAFSGTDVQHEAISAIAAAQSTDDRALRKHISAALKDSASSVPLQRAATRTLLAVALVEAGRPNDAKEMIQGARESGSREWLGVSNLFGSPILVHLLIRLDMIEELQELMNSLDSRDDELSQIPYHANLQAIGTTYASLNRLEDADRRYGEITSSLDRVHLAVGVLFGLRNGR